MLAIACMVTLSALLHRTCDYMHASNQDEVLRLSGTAILYCIISILLQGHFVGHIIYAPRTYGSVQSISFVISCNYSSHYILKYSSHDHYISSNIAVTIVLLLTALSESIDYMQ